MFLRIVLILIGIVVLTVVIAVAVATVYGIVPLLLCGTIAVAVFVYTAGKRRERQAMLAWHLALAVERGRSPAEQLRLFGDELPKWWRDRLELVWRRAEGGVPLSEAIGTDQGLLPKWALVSIRIGEKSGQLPRALLEVARRMTSRPAFGGSGALGSGLMSITYLVVGLLVILSVLTFLSIFIVPKFKRIFEGFDSELPIVTRTAIDAVDFYSEYVWILTPIQGAVMFLAGWLAYVWYRGWSDVDAPFAAWWQRRFDLPNVARDLATAVEGSLPLPDALDELADRHPHRHVRHRLGIVADDVRDGDEVWPTFRDNGFLSGAEVTLLESSERVGNLPWALRELADGRERRGWFRALALAQFLEPIAVLVMGFVIGFVAIAFFLPLVKLLNDLS